MGSSRTRSAWDFLAEKKNVNNFQSLFRFRINSANHIATSFPIQISFKMSAWQEKQIQKEIDAGISVSSNFKRVGPSERAQHAAVHVNANVLNEICAAGGTCTVIEVGNPNGCANEAHLVTAYKDLRLRGVLPMIEEGHVHGFLNGDEELVQFQGRHGPYQGLPCVAAEIEGDKSAYANKGKNDIGIADAWQAKHRPSQDKINLMEDAILIHAKNMMVEEAIQSAADKVQAYTIALDTKAELQSKPFLGGVVDTKEIDAWVKQTKILGEAGKIALGDLDGEIARRKRARAEVVTGGKDTPQAIWQKAQIADHDIEMAVEGKKNAEDLLDVAKSKQRVGELYTHLEGLKGEMQSAQLTNSLTLRDQPEGDNAKKVTIEGTFKAATRPGSKDFAAVQHQNQFHLSKSEKEAAKLITHAGLISNKEGSTLDFTEEKKKIEEASKLKLTARIVFIPTIKATRLTEGVAIPSLKLYGGNKRNIPLFGGMAYGNMDETEDMISTRLHNRITTGYDKIVLEENLGERMIKHQVARTEISDDAIAVGSRDEIWASIPAISVFGLLLQVGGQRTDKCTYPMLIRAGPIPLRHFGVFQAIVKGADEPNENGLIRLIAYMA